MSAHTPIIPPGSPLHGTKRVRNSKLIYAVSAILAVHLVLLSGLLIQGCKQEDKGTDLTQDNLTNSLPAMGSAPAASLPPTERTKAVAPVDSAPVQRSFSPPPIEGSTPPVPPPPVVVSDPAPPAADSGRVTATHTDLLPKVTSGLNHGETATVTYTVKPGDNLTKVAKAHGTTLKAIREANALKTDRILVGQKLKVPQGSTPPTAGELGTSSPLPPKPVGQ
jgi:LysM repeat protein